LSRLKSILASIVLALLFLGSNAGALGPTEHHNKTPPHAEWPSGIVYSDPALTYRVASEYSTATAVVPRFYGSSSPDSVPGRFRYSYTLVNDPLSTNTIWAFALNPVPRPITVTPPKSWQWTFGYQLEDSALFFDSDPDSNPPPVGWDSLTVARSTHDLAPGDSLVFGFVSDRPPSVTLFYVQGYYQDSTASDTSVTYWPISIWNNSVTGTVIAPGTTTGASGMESPGSPMLRAPTPNPSAANASVAFYLPRPGKVLLGAYDVSGRLVQVLSSRTYPAGLHSAIWNGLTSTGQRAATGVYFFKLTVDGKSVGGRKMVLVR